MDGNIENAHIPNAATAVDPHIPLCNRRPRSVPLLLDRRRRLSEKVNYDRALLIARELDVIEAVQTRDPNRFASLVSDADLRGIHFASSG
jgi:hypothetical protein